MLSVCCIYCCGMWIAFGKPFISCVRLFSDRLCTSLIIWDLICMTKCSLNAIGGGLFGVLQRIWTRESWRSSNSWFGMARGPHPTSRLISLWSWPGERHVFNISKTHIWNLTFEWAFNLLMQLHAWGWGKKLPLPVQFVWVRFLFLHFGANNLPGKSEELFWLGNVCVCVVVSNI